MSLEYILAGAAGLLTILFLGFVGFILAILAITKLTGRSPVNVVAPTAPVDPLVDAAERLVKVVESGRTRGAMKVIDRLAEHEGDMFAANVATGVSPKAPAQPPSQ